MYLHQLSASGSKKKRKRVGRGPGSGHGKTSGRGQKGQKSRSGGKIKRGFEGGQMPLHRRLPKFGFTNLFRTEYHIVNLGTLEESHRVESGETLTPEILKDKGFISNLKRPVKLLANGDLSKSLTIQVDASSKSAMDKVKAVGGQVTLTQ